jgi:hypothetical protein
MDRAEVVAQLKEFGQSLAHYADQIASESPQRHGNLVPQIRQLAKRAIEAVKTAYPEEEAAMLRTDAKAFAESINDRSVASVVLVAAENLNPLRMRLDQS